MKRNLFFKIVLLALCIFAISCKENEPEEHIHSAGEIAIENIIKPTSTSMGSYDEVIYCTICNEEMSRITKKYSGHTHMAAKPVKENIIEPTPSSSGSYDEVIYCMICNEEMSRVFIESNEHTHKAGEVVKENVIKATMLTKGSYDEVTYCTICHEEMSRKTIITDKLDHEHVASNKVKEDIVTPNPVLDTEFFGSYDEVTYCTICHEELTRDHIDNYFYQFDYLELSSTVNNLDNLIDLGNGKHLLNAKTNNGKNIRIIIDGEYEKLENGWLKLPDETLIYALDAMPGINYIEYDINYEGGNTTFLGLFYNFDKKTSVNSYEELYPIYGDCLWLNNSMLVCNFDYFGLQSYYRPTDIYSLKIYYCDVNTYLSKIDIEYDLMTAYVPGDKVSVNHKFGFDIYFDNEANLVKDYKISTSVVDNSLYKLGNIIASDGSVYSKEERMLEIGDKLEVTIGGFTDYIDICVDTFEGENLYESITTQILNSKGTQNVLVVPITFIDQLDRLNDNALLAIKSSLGNVINDDGTISKYSIGNGQLSLSEYIFASSYGQLTINSYILDPTNPYVINGNGTDYYSRDIMQSIIFEEVEDWIKLNSKLDLSMFDQNGDGYFDAIIFINTLDTVKDSPLGSGYTRVGLSGSFVSHRTYYRDLAETTDEPNINTYINMPMHSLYKDMKIGDGDIQNLYTQVLVHEFGHVLGLADYYDTDVDKDGAMGDTIGGFDMQSSNQGDWNAYSKYALGWIDPIIVDGTKDEYTITLSPYSATGQAILIHGLNYDFNGTPFDEYIMIELFAHDGLYESESEFYGLQNSVGVKIYHINSVYEKRTYENSDGTTGVVGTIHHSNSSSTKFVSEGKFLIELIQNGNVNTLQTHQRANIQSEDLFYENDVFTVESYDNFFYNGLMDDGSEFGYKITIEKIVNDGENSLATIKIEKQ